MVWSVESAKLDGSDIWRMNAHRFVLAGGDNKGISHVDVDQNTFRPIRSDSGIRCWAIRTPTIRPTKWS